MIVAHGDLLEGSQLLLGIGERMPALSGHRLPSRSRWPGPRGSAGVLASAVPFAAPSDRPPKIGAIPFAPENAVPTLDRRQANAISNDIWSHLRLASGDGFSDAAFGQCRKNARLYDIPNLGSFKAEFLHLSESLGSLFFGLQVHEVRG